LLITITTTYFILPHEAIFSAIYGIRNAALLKSSNNYSLEILSKAIRIHSPSTDIEVFFNFPLRVRAWLLLRSQSM
jgi:hypothetical protein